MYNNNAGNVGVPFRILCTLTVYQTQKKTLVCRPVHTEKHMKRTKCIIKSIHCIRAFPRGLNPRARIHLQNKAPM
jgi:hypothetical protein